MNTQIQIDNRWTVRQEMVDGQIDWLRWHCLTDNGSQEPWRPLVGSWRKSPQRVSAAGLQRGRPHTPSPPRSVFGDVLKMLGLCHHRLASVPGRQILEPAPPAGSRPSGFRANEFLCDHKQIQIESHSSEGFQAFSCYTSGNNNTISSPPRLQTEIGEPCPLKRQIGRAGGADDSTSGLRFLMRSDPRRQNIYLVKGIFIFPIHLMPSIKLQKYIHLIAEKYSIPNGIRNIADLSGIQLHFPNIFITAQQTLNAHPQVI